MTVKGIKPRKGVQVPVKEPQSLGPVASWKAMASPSEAASRAPDPALTEAEERFAGGFERGCTGCHTRVCTHLRAQTHTCALLAPGIPRSGHEIPAFMFRLVVTNLY